MTKMSIFPNYERPLEWSSNALTPYQYQSTKHPLWAQSLYPQTRTTRSEPRRGCESALREVQLWDATKDILKEKATGLTLEQQQKLCIARLLPLKPQVIPWTNRAPPSTRRHRQGEPSAPCENFTIVMVTHNMGQARRASDECIYMYLGEIIEHAPTDQLFLNPRGRRRPCISKDVTDKPS